MIIVKEYVESMTDHPELVDMLGNEGSYEKTKEAPYEEVSILTILKFGQS